MLTSFQMNAVSVLNFVQILDNKIAMFPTRQVVYCAERGRRNLTNAAFLLGSYLVMRQNEEPTRVWDRFVQIKGLFDAYRDATYSEPDFELTLLDCWQGLARGKSLGWIDLPSDDPEMEKMCGRIMIAEYEHCTCPLPLPSPLTPLPSPRADRNESDRILALRPSSPKHRNAVVGQMTIHSTGICILWFPTALSHSRCATSRKTQTPNPKQSGVPPRPTPVPSLRGRNPKTETLKGPEP